MKLGPYELNSIVTGDARELAESIPDESVDLIFTDPIYSNIDDYWWLAETAGRVLKPDGNLLCWSNGKWHYQNAKWLESAGLTYHWTFDVVTTTQSAPMNGKIISKVNRLLWFKLTNERNMNDYLVDGYGVIGGEWTIAPIAHHWGKSNIYTARAIEALSDARAILFDPFCGSGITLAVAQQCRRMFLGFEIDPDTADKARQRVAMTQPPLFVVQPEQLELIEEAA